MRTSLSPRWRLGHGPAVFLFIAQVICWPAFGQVATILYETDFNSTKRYQSNLSLVGQDGWSGNRVEGSRIGSESDGLFAFIGGGEMPAGENTILLRRNLGYTPSPDAMWVDLKARVRISESTNGTFDDFAWAFANSNGEFLFSVLFDNMHRRIHFAEDDGSGDSPFISYGLTFDRETEYDLRILMDFGTNRWSAWLNEAIIASDRRIAQPNNALNLAFLDVAWLPVGFFAVGNNRMEFDDISVTSGTFSFPVPVNPRLEISRKESEGQFELVLFGNQGRYYTISASRNLTDWVMIDDFLLQEDSHQIIDTTQTRSNIRFYRADEIPVDKLTPIDL